MNKRMAIIFLTAGLVCLGISIYLFTKTENKTNNTVELSSNKEIISSEKGDSSTEKKNISREIDSGSSEIKNNETGSAKKVTDKNKGNDFEDYTIQFLAKNKELKLISKVSDYYKNGVSAKENSEPDLKFKYHKFNFAVECKYRTAFYGGKVEWAKKYNINNYRNYQKDNNIKVFIALGIGGTADNPSKFFLIPLYRLTKEFAFEDYIKEFEVKGSGDLMKIINNYLLD